MIGFFKGTLLAILHKFWGNPEYVRLAARLAKLVFHHKMHILVAVICMAGYNVFTAAPAWYIKNIVDALGKGGLPEISRFVLVGGGIVGIFVLKGFFYFWQSYLMGLIGQKVIAQLRSLLFEHIQKLGFSFFTKNPAGDLISRFTSDMLSLQNALRMGVSGPLRDIPQIFILLGILVFRSWELFLLSLILIPIALFLIGQFGRKNNKLTTERLNSFSQMTSLVMETISGIRVVKAFGMEKYETDRFEKANQDLLVKYMKTTAITSYSTPLLEIIGAVAGASIVMFGGYLIIHDQITGGDFVSFIFAFFLMNEPIRKLNGFNLNLHEGISSLGRIYQVLDLKPEVEDAPDAVELEPISKSLSVSVNSFFYEGVEEPILKEVNLEIKAGEVAALVGQSGSGKTTLVNLIPRFFPLHDGSIKIDGLDISKGTLASLRRQIAIVTQEIFLFNDTVTNNIAYGNIDCPKENVIEAAKQANAHDFIMDLPKGYETTIGESGLHLSGGQRQRLAIARALIKDAPILILDEATSALDSESEVEVQRALENLLANRTTIVIAHRLSTIQRANTIYVLEKGRIIEQGQHQELLDKSGRYKELHEIQFRYTQEEPADNPWRRLWQRVREGGHITRNRS